MSFFQPMCSSQPGDAVLLRPVKYDLIFGPALVYFGNRWYVLMANRMEKNTMQTHRFNLKSIVETLKKLVSCSSDCISSVLSLLLHCARVRCALVRPAPPPHPLFFCSAVRVLHDSCLSGRGQRRSGESQRARGEQVLRGSHRRKTRC